MRLDWIDCDVSTPRDATLKTVIETSGGSPVDVLVFVLCFWLDDLLCLTYRGGRWFDCLPQIHTVLFFH